MVVSLGALLFLIVLGVLAYVVFRGVRRSRGKVSEPSCGKCGYAVTGLETMVCPECGSDLRVVGIVTPAMQFKQRSSIIVPILTWAFLVLIVGGNVSEIVASSVAMVLHTNSTKTYTSRSSAYDAVDLVLDGSSAEQRNPVADTCDVKLRLNDGRVVTMHVLDEQLTCEVDSGSIGGAGWLDRDVLLAWMKSVGIDTSLQQVRDEADDLSVLVNAAFTYPIMGSSPAPHALMKSGRSVMSRSSTPVWFLLTSLVFWIVVWGVGVYLMVLGRRREMQRLGI